MYISWINRLFGRNMFNETRIIMKVKKTIQTLYQFCYRNQVDLKCRNMFGWIIYAWFVFIFFVIASFVSWQRNAKCILTHNYLYWANHFGNPWQQGLPVHFCRKNLPKQDGVITLIDEDGDEYSTIYLPRRTGLSGGWKGFAVAHDLADGDALVFQLIKRTAFKVIKYWWWLIHSLVSYKDIHEF